MLMSKIYVVNSDMKNSKVFEQKGDLLNFKANIDPMAVLSQVKPDWVKLGQAGPSLVKLSRGVIVYTVYTLYTIFQTFAFFFAFT